MGKRFILTFPLMLVLSKSLFDGFFFFFDSYVFGKEIVCFWKKDRKHFIVIIYVMCIFLIIEISGKQENSPGLMFF